MRTTTPDTRCGRCALPSGCTSGTSSHHESLHSMVSALWTLLHLCPRPPLLRLFSLATHHTRPQPSVPAASAPAASAL
eukprot:7049757-Prymnesium_polylepis.1